MCVEELEWRSDVIPCMCVCVYMFMCMLICIRMCVCRDCVCAFCVMLTPYYASMFMLYQILWDVVLKRLRTSMSRAGDLLQHTHAKEHAASLKTAVIQTMRTRWRAWRGPISPLPPASFHGARATSSSAIAITVSPRSTSIVATTDGIPLSPRQDATAKALALKQTQLAQQESQTTIALGCATVFVVVLTLIAARVFSSSEGCTYGLTSVS